MQPASPFALSPRGLFNLWFGFRAPVNRLTYLVSGLFLLLVKYAGDALITWSQAGIVWNPVQYLSPFWSSRLDSVSSETSPFLIASMVTWSLPFIWIGVSMSARRARHAGLHAGLALLFFVPLINYFMMLVLCLARSRATSEPRAVLNTSDSSDPHRSTDLKAVAGGALTGGLFLAAAFSILESAYGFGLFIGAPFAVGMVTAYLANRYQRKSGWRTQVVAQVALVLGAGTLLLLGIEGMICLAMAFPIGMVVTALGALLGQAIAQPPDALEPWSVALLIALSPLVTAFDRYLPEPPLREVVTILEVDAPPAVVWRHVVAFSELPPPNALVFRLGIAHPIRARIEGHGVGAVRYCEFSTGPFVEPITRWEEPHRLSFDVVAQPPSMEEWSPYDIHPPHLTESLTSERGEFRLVELDGGRTRLEGSTWYRHELFPQPYWNLWSDWLIHRIHQRVLHHIANRSEAALGQNHLESRADG